ncbi:MAG TPA: hypothetical protein PKD65_19865, partial [Nitrospira sp.]|nr:hypothetical protein [Nitrospira sp.]
VHDLGEEEVMLDLLDAETFERNEWAYLHRSYARWELGLSDQEKAARQKAKSIWGDTFRMRGMKMDINPESIHAPAPWFEGEMKGKKVTVLKKARADGKFSRAMVVGAIPEKYSTWTVDGDWEIIDAKKGNFVVRRDYTPEERQDMGEIEDIRFATVKTLQHMIHNVEVAKFFEWVAATEAADEVPEGGIIADPSESLTRAFKKDEWVLVPDSKLTGTSVKRYGALAGKYVPGPVWNDIRQLANRHYAPFGKTYAAILKAWKISKTALSPAVHMNNVMANLVMADWHDVEATHLLAAIKAMANDDRALIDAFEDNGGSEGMYAISELQREQLQPIIDALEEELSGEIQGQGMVGVLAALRILFDARLSGLMKSSPWREAWEAYRLGRAYKWPAKAVDKMIQLYQDEDTVFRLAAFIKAKEDGLTDKGAGKFARQSFLDYQINAPWIQAMRNTAFPFISFTYRALPMLIDTAAHKPWKLMKLGLTLGALNALFTAMAGGDDDEDRKYLPVEKSGRVLGFVAPKLIRMPWNGEHDAPVFLDIRRWIPVGDIVDIGQEHSAIPLLPSMMPGGPLVVLGEVVFNTSAFTGKKITKSTDTGLSDALGHGDLSMERYVKVVDHLYKAFMPNIMGLPGTYATAKVADAATGKTDSFGREYSTASAMASGFGVKVAAYPKDVGKLSNDLDYLAKEREIADNIRSLERQKKRKGISREEYRDALKQEMEKLRRAEEERAQ